MYETNVAGFRETNREEEAKNFASSSESRVNPVAELLKKIYYPVDEVPPVNTDVSKVCNKEQCDF